MQFKRVLLGVASGVGYGFSLSLLFVAAHGWGKLALVSFMLFLNIVSLAGLRRAYPN